MDVPKLLEAFCKGLGFRGLYRLACAEGLGVAGA